MRIRTRLSLYFTLSNALLLAGVMIAIYWLFSAPLQKAFYQTLKGRALAAADVYLEADEVSDFVLQRFKQEYARTLPREVVRIYDQHDKAVFIPDPQLRWDHSVIDRVRRDGHVRYMVGNDAVAGILYHDNQGDFVILVRAYDEEGQQALHNLLKILSLLYVVQLVLLFYAGRWLARKAIDPIERINRQVTRISATDLHVRVDEPGGQDEISALATNFNQLLDRLETSFEVQKMFIANTSHELRTPITSIIGEIEVTVSKRRTAEEYEQTLQSVLLEAGHLSGIIDSFLSLANAEQLFVEKTEAVRLDELLWKVRSDAEKEWPSKVFVSVVSLPEEEEGLIVRANRNLLEIALLNVIKNALKFSSFQPVDCFLQCAGSGMLIRIVDKGIGIDPSLVQKIFEPFYRAPDAARFEGHGMGLFIVKKILDLYGATITIDSMPAAGTSINILFAKNAGV